MLKKHLLSMVMVADICMCLAYKHYSAYLANLTNQPHRSLMNIMPCVVFALPLIKTENVIYRK